MQWRNVQPPAASADNHAPPAASDGRHMSPKESFTASLSERTREQSGARPRHPRTRPGW